MDVIIVRKEGLTFFCIIMSFISIRHFFCSVLERGTKVGEGDRLEENKGRRRGRQKRRKR